MKKLIAAVLAAGLLSSLAAPAGAAGQKVEKTATVERAPSQTCVPADGAQILAGFAAPGDWVDSQTGELCNRR